MIKTKDDLKTWIKKDFDSYRMQYPILARFSYGENWELFSFMKNMRYLEYYTNKENKNIIDKCCKIFRWLLHRRKIKKLDITIFPNSVGPGFHLQHRGFRRIGRYTRIGADCEILPMVLMGKKKPDLYREDIEIGDKCYISTGVTILGPVKIGNNVTIAAGAVVTSDLPDNCVAGGVPAKILKYK